MRRVRVALTLGWLGCAYPAASAAPPGAPPEGRRGEVTAEDLEGLPALQIEELLEGRVAGVRLVRLPGGGISLRLWGPSTIYGDNEPLYVLDGMPLHVTPGRGLDWLNPGDILRIEILKDVNATALYGMRGANGVVLITTRRGSRGPD
jgi:TonB-dependent SusC/RagA subfamily outer membrane receptor